MHDEALVQALGETWLMRDVWRRDVMADGTSLRHVRLSNHPTAPTSAKLFRKG